MHLMQLILIITICRKLPLKAIGALSEYIIRPMLVIKSVMLDGALDYKLEDKYAHTFL